MSQALLTPLTLELDGQDLRREPLEMRKATFGRLRKTRHGVRFNEHLEYPDGLAVFQHACKMGLEGIVSKRLAHAMLRPIAGSAQFKNPEAPAVRREAEEDWR